MRLVLILSMIILSVSASTRDTYEKCAPMLESQEGISKCCDDKVFAGQREEIAECLKIPSTPTSCERETCIANKKGFLKPNGDVDINKIGLDVDSTGGDEEMLHVLKDKCLFNTDLDAYTMEGVCQPKKLFNCIRAQILFNCKNWKESDSCNELKESVENCKDLY